jgi:hypothetical protein
MKFLVKYGSGLLASILCAALFAAVLAAYCLGL